MTSSVIWHVWQVFCWWKAPSPLFLLPLLLRVTNDDVIVGIISLTDRIPSRQWATRQALERFPSPQDDELGREFLKRRKCIYFQIRKGKGIQEELRILLLLAISLYGTFFFFFLKKFSFFFFFLPRRRCIMTFATLTRATSSRWSRSSKRIGRFASITA